LISEILINTDTFNKISSPPKVLIADNSFIAEPKLPSPSVTYYPSTLFLKVPLYPTSKLKLVTEELIAEPPELTVLSLVTPKTV